MTYLKGSKKQYLIAWRLYLTNYMRTTHEMMTTYRKLALRAKLSHKTILDTIAKASKMTDKEAQAFLLDKMKHIHAE